jgi:hypothetical protein
VAGTLKEKKYNQGGLTMAGLRCDSYCGLYCGACEIINAKTAEQKRRVIQLFESNIPGWHASSEEMKCSGCKTENVFANCAKCPIRPCAQSKGVEFCHQCPDYPCQIHGFLQKASSQVPVLRHLKAIDDNQQYIKANGVSAWLNEQEDKWKCPACGNEFSWYADVCAGCGHDLRGTKDWERK